MNHNQKNAWHRIEQYSLDAIDVSFPFSARLARENNWSIAYAKKVIEEYKKFMFLIKVAGHPCTPSDEVDQVWHLHLVYTRDYWQVWCKDVLEQDIHHGPTKGGNKEKVKFHDWYEKTKTTYRQLFGSEPPEQIWPSSKIRFSEIDFRRVNTHRNFVLSKVKVMTGTIAMFSFTFLTFHTTASTTEKVGFEVVVIIFFVFILIIGLVWGDSGKKGNKGGGCGSSDGDSGCGSGCSGCGGGGCGGCG